MPFCHRSMDIFACMQCCLKTFFRLTHGGNAAAKRHVAVGSAGHDHNSRTDRTATRNATSRSWRSDSTVRSKLGPGLGLTCREPHPGVATRRPVSYRAKGTGSNQQAKRLFHAICCEAWGKSQQMKWGMVQGELLLVRSGVMGPL